jgi:hypothetical protein
VGKSTVDDEVTKVEDPSSLELELLLIKLNRIFVTKYRQKLE